MLKSKLLFPAEGISVDQFTNNASAFNIIEQLNFQSLPVVFPKLVVLTLMEREASDPQEFGANLTIVLAGNEIAKIALEFKFQNSLRHRNIVTLGGLPITQPGIMEIFITVNGEKIVSYSIEVTVPKGINTEKIVK